MRAGAIMSAVVATSMVAGCLYTDGVNGEPQARIAKDTQGPHFRDSQVTMSARASTDPDHDLLHAKWVAVQCLDAAGTDCPADAQQVIAERTTDLLTNFTFRVRDKTPVLVTLTVSDTRGATTQDWMFVEVQNRDPMVGLQRSPLNTSYTIGTAVRVVATATDPDGDTPFYFVARPLPPRGSLPDDTRFEKVEDTGSTATWEIEPDVIGVWFVEVTVRDGPGADAGEVVDMIPVNFVADQPPCLLGTDPLAVAGGTYIVDSAGGVRRFAVTNVSDDLDPYPAGSGDAEAETTFRWYLASPDTGGELVAIANVGADFIVDPAAYAAGDALELRVEIADRVDRGALPCSDEIASCSYTGDQGCVQRVTWEVEIR